VFLSCGRRRRCHQLAETTGECRKGWREAAPGLARAGAHEQPHGAYPAAPWALHGPGLPRVSAGGGCSCQAAELDNQAAAGINAWTVQGSLTGPRDQTEAGHARGSSWLAERKSTGRVVSSRFSSELLSVTLLLLIGRRGGRMAGNHEHPPMAG